MGQAPGKAVGNFVIGLVLPLEGSQAVLGEEALAGIHLAASDLMKEDPQLAAQISLVVASDKSKPSGAKEAALSLAKRRVSIFLGSLTRSHTEELAKVAAKERKPLIVPFACADENPLKGARVFHSCFSSPWQGKLLGNFAGETLRRRKAALLFDPQAKPDVAIVDLFRKSFEAKGWEIVHREYFDSSSILDFMPHIEVILKTEADVILFPSGDRHKAERFLKQLAMKKVKLPILGPTSWHQRSLANAFPGGIENYFVVPYSTELETPEARHFAREFAKQKKRRPSIIAALAYDAYQLAARSFKNAQGVGEKELTRSLEQIKDLPSLLGSANMSAERFLERPGLVMQMGRGRFFFRGLVSP